MAQKRSESNNHPRALQETRLQGSVTFPCTMYCADAQMNAEPSPFYAKPHWHDAIEILYFRRGSFSLTVNTEPVTITQETICFVESGSLHAIYSEKEYEEYAFLFDPFFLSASHPDEAGQLLIDPLQRGQLHFPQLLTASDTGFEEICDEFMHLQQIFSRQGAARADQIILQTPASQLRVRACLLNILATLAENDLLRVSEQSTDPRADALKKVMLYIQEHYAEKIYLHDLAQIMNMNEQYFCRFFKKTTQKTPVSYINELRIRHAALLLCEEADHAIPVSEVAAACGFDNMGHFITQFRRVTGASPLEYRRQQRQTEAAPGKPGRR